MLHVPRVEIRVKGHDWVRVSPPLCLEFTSRGQKDKITSEPITFIQKYTH